MYDSSHGVLTTQRHGGVVGLLILLVTDEKVTGDEVVTGSNGNSGRNGKGASW